MVFRMRQLSLFPDQAATESPKPLVAQKEQPQSEKPSRIHVLADGASLVLAAQLSSLLREPVEVELTDNAWTMVSYRRVQGRLHFRLHHMFARAHEPVIGALAGFTGKNRRAHGRAIDEYVRKHRDLIRRSSPRDEQPLATRGRVHDLAELYQSINARHFGDQVRARIGWGRRAPNQRRRSIKMGVYFHDQKIIRIHPALDDERVPRHFVEMVVFHEMLHQIFPPSAGEDGRRTVHGKAFREAERRFPGYERARAWENAHLHLLLRQRSGAQGTTKVEP
jgi:predicted SprT family Zn-dependent metalloprotease